jgi:hypothetical protein
MDLIVPQGAVVLVVVQVVRSLVRVESQAPSLRRLAFGLPVRVPSLQLRLAPLSRLTFRAHAQAQAAAVVVASAVVAEAAARVPRRSTVVHAAVDLSSRRTARASTARSVLLKFGSLTMTEQCLVFFLRSKR